MTKDAGSLQLAPDTLLHSLQMAAKNLDGELELDFTSIPRIDSRALHALEQLVAAADQKGVRIVLRNVNVALYKALTLEKLVRHLTFA